MKHSQMTKEGIPFVWLYWDERDRNALRTGWLEQKWKCYNEIQVVKT